MRSGSVQQRGSLDANSQIRWYRRLFHAARTPEGRNLSGNNGKGRQRAAIGRIALLTAYLWSPGVMLNVNVPLTNSGVLAIYGSDVASLPGMGFVIWRLWSRRGSISRALRIFFTGYVGFFAYCLIVLVFRHFNGFDDMQSLVIPRANLTCSLILIFLVLGDISFRELMISAYAFSTTLAIAAAPLAIYDIYLPFTVFENLAIRTDLQLFLAPVLLVGLLRRDRLGLGNAVYWLFALNLGSLLFCSAVSGARLNAVLIPVVVVVAAILTLRRRVGRGMRFGVSVAIPVVLIAALLPVAASQSVRVQYGLERNILYSAVNDFFTSSGSADPALPAVVQPTEPPADSQTAATAPGKSGAAIDAEMSKATSTSVRTEVWAKAWKDFSANIWFGTGLKQYKVVYSLDTQYTSIIQPHNFLLEYLMSYGIFGLVFWLFVVLYWPVVAIRQASQRASLEVAMLILSLVLVFTVSFFEPLMLYPDILLTFYLIIGCFAIFIGRRVRPPFDGSSDSRVVDPPGAGVGGGGQNA